MFDFQKLLRQAKSASTITTTQESEPMAKQITKADMTATIAAMQSEIERLSAAQRPAAGAKRTYLAQNMENGVAITLFEAIETATWLATEYVRADGLTRKNRPMLVLSYAAHKGNPEDVVFEAYTPVYGKDGTQVIGKWSHQPVWDVRSFCLSGFVAVTALRPAGPADNTWETTHKFATVAKAHALRMLQAGTPVTKTIKPLEEGVEIVRRGSTVVKTFKTVVTPTTAETVAETVAAIQAKRAAHAARIAVETTPVVIQDVRDLEQMTELYEALDARLGFGHTVPVSAQ